MNILITNISRREYFVNFFLDIKKNFKNLKIHLADNDSFAPVLNFSNTTRHKTPKVSEGEKKYLFAIKNIVKKEKINLIIPVTNFDLEIFSKKKKEFEIFNCRILVSSPEFIKICLDKKKTYSFCLTNKIKTPKIYKNFKKIKKNLNKIYVKKDRFGNTSSGFEKLKHIKKEDFNKNYIVQDFIKGQEYHLDILNDLNGNYIASCAKKKISMRSGETDKALVIYENKLKNLCKKISDNSKHVGNLDCDIIIKDNNFYIIDLNPRFGGGYAFTHLAGLNYLKSIIYSLAGKKYNLPKKPKFIKAAKTINIKICK